MRIKKESEWLWVALAFFLVNLYGVATVNVSSNELYVYLDILKEDIHNVPQKAWQSDAD